ncbi:Protein FAR-RED IMPAIRED RESPONSE 1 [Platanthera zijinensis]|uniref:Protein FAR1-RELATED SEQUENCE n=1 Tax=Platanthera zijinensis TaxID=2320716 RepID=A0AAP0AVQ9_9ASPA
MFCEIRISGGEMNVECSEVLPQAISMNCICCPIFLRIPSKYPTFPVVQSEDEAYALYCEYAHKTGFSVRKEHIIYWTHTRIIKVREYTCSKAGNKHIKPSPIKYRKLDSRTGCLACCHFRTDTNGQNWTVSKFVEEHNHPLALDKEKHLLRSNRKYWSDMMLKGSLQDNRWLKDLYLVRHKWSTAYNKDVLDLGILSTQRSESANNGLHGCSKATSSLVECFIGLEKLVSTWRRAELDEDFKCTQGSVSLKYKGSNLLKQVSKVFTRKMFSIFEKSFMEGAIGVSIVNEVMYDDNNILYGTAQCDEDQDGKNWFVNFNTSTGEAKCSCRGFETKGIQCKHVLRIFIHRNVKHVPAQYLLKRFSLNAKRGIYLPYLPSMAQKESNMIFRNHLMRFTYDLSLQIESCQPAKELVMIAMNDLARRVESLVVEDANHNDKEESSLRDPPKKRPKGISNTRLKGYWEKNTKKSRKKVGVKKQTMSTYHFLDSPAHAHQSTPSANNRDLDSKEEFDLDLSFNFSSIPDVFKP